MNETLSIAAAGMNAGSAAFSKSAADAVKAATSDGEMPQALAGMALSGFAFRANIAVFKTAERMTGTLLDMFV